MMDRSLSFSRATCITVACAIVGAAAWADPVPEGGALTAGFGYDAEGRLTTINLPKGQGQPAARQNEFLYDSLGRRIQSTLAAPAPSASSPVIKQGWDGLDQLKSVQDPRSTGVDGHLTTTYTVDGLGQRLRLSSPDSGTGTVDTTYYPDGLPKVYTDARGKTFTYEWDDLGRLSKVAYSKGTATVYTYDNCTTGTSTTSVGQLCKITDESGTTTYTHDGFGRVLTKKQVVRYMPADSTAAINRTFQHTLVWGMPDGAAQDIGNLKSHTYPSKARVNYIYDPTTRQLQSITLTPVKPDGSGTAGPAATKTLLSGLQFHPLGGAKSWLWGDNVSYSRGFDNHARLSTYPLGDPVGSGTAAGLLRTLGYDDAGRISSYTHSGNAANPSSYDQTFGYDGLDRLTANQQATNYGYEYDLGHNRTKITVGGNSYTQDISPNSNRVSKERDQDGQRGLGYWLNGSLKSDGVNTYAYSDRGRLSKATLPSGAVANYLYNGLEQRVVKHSTSLSVVDGARYFAYDEAGHLIGEYDKNGDPVYEVVFLGDTPVAVITQTSTGSPVQISTQIHYIYADHINTPRVIVQSDNHAIRWRWDQAEAFGNSVANENPSGLGVFTFNLRFPGQTFDSETGWFYNHHRDYRAAAGRYAQSDPIGLQGGINTYAYVEGNPVSRFDMSGLVSCQICTSAGNEGALQCLSQSGDVLVGQVSAGAPGYENNWKFQKEKNKGPLPQAAYTMHVYEPTKTPFSLKDPANNDFPGIYLQPTMPSKIWPRNGFFFHKRGPNPAGCPVTDDKSYEWLDKALRDDGFMGDLTVGGC